MKNTSYFPFSNGFQVAFIYDLGFPQANPILFNKKKRTIPSQKKTNLMTFSINFPTNKINGNRQVAPNDAEISNPLPS